MTSAPDPRLGEIEAEAVEAAARAAAKDEDASNCDDEHEYYRNGWRNRMQVGLEAAHPVLLAELRKRDDALARVATLADRWTDRGEHDMDYSKTIPDEDIAMAILTDGATKVENARHVRNALRGEG